MTVLLWDLQSGCLLLHLYMHQNEGKRVITCCFPLIGLLFAFFAAQS
jgi:hypothetical protein